MTFKASCFVLSFNSSEVISNYKTNQQIIKSTNQQIIKSSNHQILSGKRDSNPRPRPWQGRALPTELFPLINLECKYNLKNYIKKIFFLYRSSFLFTENFFYLVQFHQRFHRSKGINICI